MHGCTTFNGNGNIHVVQILVSLRYPLGRLWCRREYGVIHQWKTEYNWYGIDNLSLRPVYWKKVPCNGSTVWKATKHKFALFAVTSLKYSCTFSNQQEEKANSSCGDWIVTPSTILCTLRLFALLSKRKVMWTPFFIGSRSIADVWREY